MPNWDDLIKFVDKHQCDWSIDPDAASESIGWGIHLDDPPPYNKLLGPVFSRGPTCGLVRQHGETLCRWGDTERADMTFSVTKTYLAMVAGIASDDGLIKNLDDTVFETLQAHQLDTNGFETAHNKTISWRNMLQFTSEWQGSCFGIPDQVDHFRQVSMQQKPETVIQTEISPAKGEKRELQTPGTFWEYNDVRINQFSLALMRLFGRPLPDIFETRIMQAIGINARENQTVDPNRAPASPWWQWHGYANSWVDNEEGKQIQSVPGGGHWGGGMVISATHQAAIAELLIGNGLNQTSKRNSAPARILSEQWVRLMQTPCDIAPYYGLYTWLNTDFCISPEAPETAFFAMGVGGQAILHDTKNQLVVVLRWINADYTTEIINMIYSKLKSSG